MAPKVVVAIIFALPMLACIANAHVTFDISKYGAKSGADISQVLLKVWKEAIASNVGSKIVIPKGTWKLSQVNLEGPNKAPIVLQVQGTVTAPSSLPNMKENWIGISYVNNLEVSGGGVFDGQGQQAWKKNDCTKNSKCAQLPINLAFHAINNSIIQDVTSKDTKGFHINLISSKNVTFNRLKISAPADSPNTDGIHLARSSHIFVTDTIIATGDDCISIGDESEEYHITGVTCGPGHGISVGSLGKYQGEKDVKGVYVEKCTFKGTDNGVRIKSWPSSPIKLIVSEMHFKDLTMINVTQPVLIDQEYCPWNQCKKNSPSLVKINNVFIDNVKGSTCTQDPVIFACSKSNPCQNVVVGNINLDYTGSVSAMTTKDSKAKTSKCSNVKPILRGKQNVPIC